MTRTRAFAVDAPMAVATGSNSPIAVETDDSDDGATGIDWSSVDRVSIDHPPHESAFETDSFYKIPVTAARPIEQPYPTPDGDVVTMQKPANDLKTAAWSLNNQPFTLGHPPNGVVDDRSYVHGFVRESRYDVDSERHRASVYIPTTDTDAQQYLNETQAVSVGFWYDVARADDNSSVDAYQKNILFDHLAAVDEGRCSVEDGCGLNVTDSRLNSNTLDADSHRAHGSIIRGFEVVSDGGECTECSAGPCSCGLHLNTDAPTSTRTQEMSTVEMNPDDDDDMIERENSPSMMDSYTTIYPRFSTTVDSTNASRPRLSDFTDKQWNDLSTLRKQRISRHALVAEDSQVPPDDFNDLKGFVVTADGELVREWLSAVNRNISQVDALDSHGVKEIRDTISTLMMAKFDADAPDDFEYPSDTQSHVDSSESTDSESDMSVDDIDLTPTDAMQSNAQRVVDALDDDSIEVEGMTDVGNSRARQIASGEELSPSDLVSGTDAMAPWWSRHASHTVESDGDGYQLIRDDEIDNWYHDNSYVSGLGWGGVDGYRWAIRKGNKIHKARGKEQPYSLDDIDSMSAELSFTESIQTDADPINVGTTVKWDWQGGEAYGKVAESKTEPGATVSVEGGSREATEDEPVYKLEVYREDDGEYRGMAVKSHSELSMWDGPSSLENDAQGFLTDETVTYNGETVLEYDGTMDEDLDDEDIPNDDYENRYVFDADTKSESSFPLVGPDGNLRRENVVAAASYADDAPNQSKLMSVLRDVNQAFDDPPLDAETIGADNANSNIETTGIMSDSDITLDDLDIDSLAERHEGVAELKTQVDEMSEQLEAVKDELESVKEQRQALDHGEVEPKASLVDGIREMSDRWSEDELLELDRDILEERYELVQDIATDVNSLETDDAVSTDSDGGNDGGSSYDHGEFVSMR